MHINLSLFGGFLGGRVKSQDLDYLRPCRIQSRWGTLKTQGGTGKQQQQQREADPVLQVTEVTDKARFLAEGEDFILGRETNQKRARSSWKPG